MAATIGLMRRVGEQCACTACALYLRCMCTHLLGDEVQEGRRRRSSVTRRRRPGVFRVDDLRWTWLQSQGQGAARRSVAACVMAADGTCMAHAHVPCSVWHACTHVCIYQAACVVGKLRKTCCGSAITGCLIRADSARVCPRSWFRHDSCR